MKVVQLYEWTKKKNFEPYPDSKNSLLGPQKVIGDPKFKSKSKVRIEEKIENKCSSTRPHE